MANNVAYDIAEGPSVDSYVCEITQSYMIIESVGMVKLYGLYMYNSKPQLAALEGEYCRVDAISECFDKVWELKCLVEEMGVYPVHLKDIAEDMLS